MTRTLILLIAVFGLVSVAPAADLHEPISGAKVYFTPGDDAEGAVVDAIASAKQQILVQTYSFTSVPIAKALAAAAEKGVKISVISDESNETTKYSAMDYIAGKNIQIVVDDRIKIAHNKVMIIDSQLVITGSFNFTKAAQHSNAENCILLPSKELALLYTANWESRFKVSRPFVKKSDR